MAKKKEYIKSNTHPDLGGFDISVTTFGEIEGTIDIDNINRFLDKNVDDKKLNKDQIKPGSS